MSASNAGITGNTLRGRLRASSSTAPAKRRMFDVYMPRAHGIRAKRVSSLPARLRSSVPAKVHAPLPSAASMQQAELPIRPAPSQAAFEPSPQHTPKHKTKLSHTKMSLMYAGLALALFAVGAGVSYLSWRTNTTVQAQVANANSEESQDDTGMPAEPDPSSDGLTKYKVAADLPRIITIPSQNVSARVLRMGVKPDGELKAPSSIFDVGWYDGSAKPGERGAMLLDGHVHGPTKPGVFAGLKKLVPGDSIMVERGNGQMLQYTVVKSRVYDAGDVDMAAAISSADPAKPGLNLITCDGAYDDMGHYNQRLVVFAVQD